MATLGPLAPNGDGTIDNAIDHESGRGTPYYTHINEDPDSAGSDHVTNDQSETDGDYFIAFVNTPVDFGTMDQDLKIKHSVDAVDDGSSNDALDCYASIVASDESTAYTDEVIIADEADTTKATTISTWVVNATGLAASKANWDGAFIKLRWDYQKTGAGDDNQCRIYAVELNGTYTVASAPITITVTAFALVGAIGSVTITNPKVVGVNVFASVAAIGNVGVSSGAPIIITVTGFALAGAIGSVTVLNPKIIGVNVFPLVGAIGNVTVTNPKIISVAEFPLVGAIGNVTVIRPRIIGVNVFSLAGAIGNVVISLGASITIPVTAFALTGSIGTVTVLNPKIIGVNELALISAINAVTTINPKVVGVSAFSLAGIFGDTTIVTTGPIVIGVNEFILLGAIGSVQAVRGMIAAVIFTLEERPITFPLTTRTIIFTLEERPTIFTLKDYND